MALVLISIFGERAYAVVGDGTSKPFVIKGQIEVQFSDQVQTRRAQRSFGRVATGVASLDAIFQRHAVSDIKAIFPWRNELSLEATDRDMSRFQILSIPEDADIHSVLAELRANDKVISANEVWAMPLAAIPNDPQWNQQYAPDRIDAELAWNVETGSDTAKIAICDSGVLYRHEDLTDKIWVNPGEDVDADEQVYDLDDLNGVDDDGNGVIDDLIGYDFFTGLGIGVLAGEDGNTPDSDPKDFDGHGTHCSSIAAGATNNGKGVAGISGGWTTTNYPTRGARIMCCRIGGTGSDGNGYVNLANAATSIDYAANMGATAINCSWGSSVSAALAAAINLAIANGVVIAKAAGNDGADNEDYMGGYPGVLAVASTGAGDGKSSFSNFGTWVEISAPGESIRAAYSNDYTATYAHLSGTSMAAPVICGAAGIIKSLHPSFDKAEIDTILTNHAFNIDGINPVHAGLLGSGRVDLWASMQNIPAAQFSPTTAVIGTPGLNVPFTDLSPNSPSAWSWDFGDAVVSTSQNPSHTYNSVGVFDVSLNVTEPRGTGYEMAKHLVVIQADTIGGGDTTDAIVGQAVGVPIKLRNFYQTKRIVFPFKYSDDGNGWSLFYDSFSVAGLRTSYFAYKQETNNDDFNKEIVIEMRSDLLTGQSNFLQPGTDPILTVWFTVLTAPTDPSILYSLTQANVVGKPLTIETMYGSWAPVFPPTLLRKSGCCDVAGDADGDASVTIGDGVYLIGYIFLGGPAPVCSQEGDADGDSSITIGDAVYLIGYIFLGGPPPVCGP